MRPTRPLHSARSVRPAAAAAVLTMLVFTSCASDDDDAGLVTTADSDIAAPTTAAATTTEPPVTTDAPATTEAPTTTAAPTTTIQVVTDAVALDGIGEEPPYEPEVVGPGTYSVELLAGLAFTTTERIQVSLVASDLAIFRDPDWPIEERAGSVVMRPIRGIVDPALVSDESMQNFAGSNPDSPANPSADQFMATPVDLPAWVAAVANVDIVDEGVIEAPGTTVRWWDLRLDAEAGPTYSCAAGTADCVAAFVLDPQGTEPLQAQNLQRVYLFDSNPGVIGIASAREQIFFDRSVELMEMIVTDLRPTG